MRYKNTKENFLEQFNTNAELRNKLIYAVERVYQITMRDKYPGGEEFENIARSSFLLINELVITEVEGAEEWQNKLNLFSNAMKTSTANSRPDSEANIISLFMDLAQFGYSLVITDEAESELHYSILWSGAKRSYSRHWNLINQE